MAINLSSTRTELETQITHYLEDHNPHSLDSWLPTLFSTKKARMIMNDICKIIRKNVGLTCTYEFSARNDVDASYYEGIKIIIPYDYFYGYICGFTSNHWLPPMVGKIVDIILHELAHFQQEKSGFKNTNKKKIPAHWIGPVAYFAQQHEVEAWAIYVASEMSRQYDPRQLLTLLSHADGQRIIYNKSRMFAKYFTLFKNNPKIWRRFLQKISHHTKTFE